MPAVGFALPQPAAHFGVGRVQFVHQGQQHAQGVLPHGISVPLGGGSQEHALAAGVFGIDVLQAGPYPADEFQAGGPVQEFGVYGNTAADDHPFIASDLVQYCLARAFKVGLVAEP